MQKKQHVHFIGIGGSGMSAIARIMLELGYHVTGSDLKTSAASERLEALGAICSLGHAEENLEGADLVVASTAIPRQTLNCSRPGKRDLESCTAARCWPG